MIHLRFAAPPARQAIDLAGKPGATFHHQRANRAGAPGAARIPAPGANDLPLTAALRRHAQLVTRAAIASALVALALFVIPLLAR